jgi:plastocyanin
MKRFVAILSILAVTFGAWGLNIQPVRALTSITQIQSGDLVRGESFSAVYYVGKDGFRYVFPTDKVYFSWYVDFNDVKWISDADLATIQIGGNVTYKPGYTMIKIDTDPKTYAVDQGGTIRWVTSEEVATLLYGSAWNTHILDVADAFFSNYAHGSDIESVDDFDVDGVMSDVDDISDDKSLKAPTYISITDNDYSADTITIDAGTAVRWTNNGASAHTATADDLSWGTGTLQSGQHFSRYFDEPGTYTYFCSYHSDMQGTIVVE